MSGVEGVLKNTHCAVYDCVLKIGISCITTNNNNESIYKAQNKKSSDAPI